MLDRDVVFTSPEYVTDDMVVAPVDDWDDDEFLYCTEFLLLGEGIDKEIVHDYVADRGGSELVVGDSGEYKVHVHTDNPAEILSYALSLGEISDVHIHNMRRQQAARPSQAQNASDAPHKKLGVISVASGSGLVDILKSLGVDVVVSGGQTMNPSTADFVEAAKSLNADEVIFLPNNKNIIMAAQSAVEVLDKPAYVVPTKSIPQAFSAMLSYIEDGEGLEVADEMTSAIADVATAEITTAIKDAKGNVGKIKEGQYIGIVNGKDIEAVGEKIDTVVTDILAFLKAQDFETCTFLAGEDLDQQHAEELTAQIEATYPDIEVELLRGEQPLYPVILSVE
jgi:DAK2 domain fusion protein YloV